VLKAAIYPPGPEAVVLANKSISFLVLQRVLQQALKTLKLNAATSDFSVINYEEAKFVITLKDGRKYTVTIAPVGEWIAAVGRIPCRAGLEGGSASPVPWAQEVGWSFLPKAPKAEPAMSVPPQSWNSESYCKEESTRR
jgi:hypothetical protein